MRFWNSKEQEVRKIIPVLFIVLAFLAVSCDAEFPSPEDEFDYNFSDRIETPDTVEPSEKVNELISELSVLCDKIDSQTLENQKTTESTNADYIYTDSSNQLVFHIYGSRQTVNGNGLYDYYVTTGEGLDDSGNECFKKNTTYHVIKVLSSGGGIAKTVPDDTAIFIGGKIADADTAETFLTEFLEIYDASPEPSEMSVQIYNTRSGVLRTDSVDDYSVSYEIVGYISSNGASSSTSSRVSFSFSPEYEGINTVIVYNDAAVELQGSSDLAGTYRYSGFASSSGQE